MKAIAVDGTGVLYIAISEFAGVRILRYSPGVAITRQPVRPVPIPTRQNSCTSSPTPSSSAWQSIQRIDHLFVHYARVMEFESAAEGNDFIRETEVATFGFATGVAKDAARHRMYASHEENRIDIFDLDQVNGANEYVLIGTIEGSAVPVDPSSTSSRPPWTKEPATSWFSTATSTEFMNSTKTAPTSTPSNMGSRLKTRPRSESTMAPSARMALNANGRYLFVPSHRSGTGHSFAFEVSKVSPPKVESVSVGSIGENEAELQAIVNPGSLATTYTLEYMTLQAFEEAGETFTGATVAGSGELPADNAGREVAATVTGLAPGTEYRFRVVATNTEGSDEATGGFTTFPAPPIEPVACPNRDLRTGLSGLLPDCRAYELVTPADTNARAPSAPQYVYSFLGRQVSPDGNSLPWYVEGGSLPGVGGTGSIGVDPYLSSPRSRWLGHHLHGSYGFRKHCGVSRRHLARSGLPVLDLEPDRTGLDPSETDGLVALPGRSFRAPWSRDPRCRSELGGQADQRRRRSHDLRHRPGRQR